MSTKRPRARRERLVQSTVTVAQFRWVNAQAEREGISVSAFIRRLVMRAMETKK